MCKPLIDGRTGGSVAQFTNEKKEDHESYKFRFPESRK